MTRDPTKPALTDPERLLLGYLHRHCRGAGRARTYERLRSDLLAAAGLAIGEREIYDLVSSLRLKRRPIGTTPAGAFIYETPRDVRMAFRNLVGRVIKQTRGIRAFKAGAREYLARQVYLDLSDAEAAYQGRVDAKAAEIAATATPPAATGLLFATHRQVGGGG